MVLFPRSYTIRRFSQISYDTGHAEGGYADMTIKADVQYTDRSSVNAEPGKNTGGKLKVFSNAQLYPAERDSRQNPDWLWYLGRWYECTSCVLYHNTLLTHYESTFAELPRQEAGPGEEAAG